jgi:hypothetical protein
MYVRETFLGLLPDFYSSSGIPHLQNPQLQVSRVEVQVSRVLVGSGVKISIFR